MKSVGIDVCYTVFNSTEEVNKALNASYAANTKLIINIKTLQIDIKNAVNQFKNHPALYGYALADEPGPNQFADLRNDLLEIRRFDDKHVVYINLHPNYVPQELINGLSYETYVKNFITEVPVQFISFDHYPIVKNKVRDNWYENLEIIRRLSYQYNLPFWAFACSTIHYNYLQPTLQAMKLQQFGNLLYGAQVLQYFTYWTLTYEDNWIKEKYSYSIVDDKGNPTPTFSIVKNVNDQIQKLAWVFLGSKTNHVYHIGNQIPTGSFELKSIPQEFQKFSTHNKAAVVSLMSNNQSKFIIVQNKSLTEILNLDYQIKKKMDRVNNKTGKTENLLLSKKYTSNILPGDILIFTYNK
ncbi:hypothetical protein [Chryseobacterium zhengzhouense]